MIFDTATIICLIATHVMVGVAPLVIRDQLWYAKKSGSLKRLQEKQARIMAGGSSNSTLKPGIVAIEIEPKFVTEYEHTEYLKKKYRTQLKEYNEYHRGDKISERMDRYILRLLLKYEAGEITVSKVSEYTIKFSNGDEIWIANKYYSYGNLHRSTSNPSMVVGNSYSVSPYTFLQIIDLEERLANPTYRYGEEQVKVKR
ncbi:hypothetical protein DQT32_05095 [Salmonella enterica subsp. enterica serovar Braenderup]|nr:hypothetical protein [Salmonella enterica subsp. enterica serovar Braenderup]